MAGVGIGGSGGDWVPDSPDDERDQWERDFVKYVEEVTYVTRKKALVVWVGTLVTQLYRMNYPTRAAKALLGAVLVSVSANCIWTCLDVKTRRSLIHRRLVETICLYGLHITNITITPLVYRYVTFLDSPARAFMVPNLFL